MICRTGSFHMQKRRLLTCPLRKKIFSQVPLNKIPLYIVGQELRLMLKFKIIQEGVKPQRLIQTHHSLPGRNLEHAVQALQSWAILQVLLCFLYEPISLSSRRALNLQACAYSATFLQYWKYQLLTFFCLFPSVSLKRFFIHKDHYALSTWNDAFTNRSLLC